MSAMNALENVSLTTMMRSVAAGIAEAQLALDLRSFLTTVSMVQNEVELGGEKYSLLDLGFTPNFYQFVDTTIQVKVSISMTEETEQETKTSESTTKSETKTEAKVSLGWFSAKAEAKSTTTTTTSSVDARFASRFQYSTEASSAVSTRLVPVPPPSEFLKVVRSLKTE